MSEKPTTEEKVNAIYEILAGGIRDGKAFEGFLQVVEHLGKTASRLETKVEILTKEVEELKNSKVQAKAWLAGAGAVGGCVAWVIQHFWK